MAQAKREAHAVVVLPTGARGLVTATEDLRWLSRGNVESVEPRTEVLFRVLQAIGAPAPTGGLAALRHWGQTGERPGAWLAAADPVHLETRLHNLRLRALASGQLPEEHICAVFDHLQSVLGNEDDYAFSNIGAYGYLRAKEAIQTADISPVIADGHVPDEFTPGGEAAAGYHRLLGELQMALHDHEVNMKRAGSGLPAINSLWIWGGGVAPERTERRLPRLFANDPLFRGYWASCSAAAEHWRGDLDDCVDRAPGGFVAVLPEMTADVQAEALAEYLRMLRKFLQAGDISLLNLIFGDGLQVVIRRRDRIRFWRGVSPDLAERPADD